MRNIGKVLKFELNSIFSKKSVRVTTLIMCIAVLIATSIPTIMTLFSSDATSSTDDNAIMDVSDIGFVFESDEITSEDFTTYFNADLNVYPNDNELRDAVKAGTINNGYIIVDATNITSITQNKDMYSYTDQIMTSLLQKINRDKALVALGIDPTVIDTVSNTPISINAIVLGKDASSSFLISYILMLDVYMLVIMYGSFVSTSVAREKDNRTMEILITSTKPSSLIIGKVLANGIGGFVQFSLILLSGVVGYLLNQSNYPSEISAMLFSGLSWDAIVIFLIFTAVGYLLYLFLYASLGSLVSKVEDVGSAVTPITLLFMVAYVLASIGINAPTSMFVKVGSFIPFTAILAMPIRYFLTTVPIFELIISLVLMSLTSVLLAFLSTKIYRLGSLSYGNKMSFIKAIKLIFAKDNIDL